MTSNNNSDVPSLEATRSLLTELDCHTVFATAILTDPSTLATPLDIDSMSENIAAVSDGLNLLQTYVGTDEKGNWKKGECAKAMTKLAMASSVCRGREIAKIVSSSWGSTDLASKKKRERSYLSALLSDSGGAEVDAKKAKLNAEKMADEILTNGEVGEEVFTVFYGKLKSIKEYHSKAGSSSVSSLVSDSAPRDGLEMLNAMSGKSTKRKGRPDVDGFDLTALVQASITPESSTSVEAGAKRLFNFSGEEVFGKYLDLTESHLQSLNISSVFSPPSEKGPLASQPVGYSQFLNLLLSSSANDVTLNLPGGVEEKIKNRKKYIKWLKALHDYLEAFLGRTMPLLDVDVEVKKVAGEALDKVWSEGEAKRWGADESAGSAGDDSFDVNEFETAKELADKLGGDGLKKQLGKLGMKSGGDVKQRSERLFALKGKKLEDLPKKFFAKGGAVVVAGEGGEATGSAGPQNKKEIALLEAVTVGFLVQLRPILDATASRAERRLTQTAMERRRERDEEISGSLREIKASSGDNEDDSDSDDEEIYNPKNLPLGWDGKPIPVWLYKLHGLNQYFSCEICGNESYRGARAYEKHFTEHKHSHGMKCLGIPNSKHFHGVVKIADAKKLWESIQAKSAMLSAPLPGVKGGVEEFEDSHGNVLSRAAYEDLARQGLL
ncbi:hypothetical protein TrVE_jg1022 [Triparma verrucosa]|uniref:Matrin-type domain-containing protein n=1 Tax=Triparma verrucosa TaxID=1606542 RepID=A0A9W7C390_9STRA|nr:hypothetical protein TrVE_jg1022 [Triparma verrucosa]